MTDFDKAIELALCTWYPENHPLRMKPHHPLGKLLGEWGELLDDYMKSLYKPGYVFEPEDELGDVWYYIRILAYQYEYKPTNLENFVGNNDKIIALVMWDCARTFCDGELFIADIKNTIDWSYSGLVEICNRYNITLDQLTKTNWNKLKPGTKRGDEWAKARASTEYIGGKVALG